MASTPSLVSYRRCWPWQPCPGEGLIECEMHGGSLQTPLCSGGVWEASSVTGPQCWSSLTARREEARKTFSCSLSKLKEGLFQFPRPSNYFYLPSFLSPLFFSPCNETGPSFLWTTGSPEITVWFIELNLGMTREELYLKLLWSCDCNRYQKCLEKTPFFPHRPILIRPLMFIYMSHKESQVCMCTQTCVSACVAVARLCAQVCQSLWVYYGKCHWVCSAWCQAGPLPWMWKKPSFNANDCHLESNASLITAHCLINVKCCVKKYIASL